MEIETVKRLVDGEIVKVGNNLFKVVWVYAAEHDFYTRNSFDPNAAISRMTDDGDGWESAVGFDIPVTKDLDGSDAYDWNEYENALIEVIRRIL